MIEQKIPPVIQPGHLAELKRSHPGLRMLDVRTPGEYESMHIPGAYNVPLDTLGEHASEIRSSVAEPVVLICQSGSRARQAEEALKSAAMANLHVLDGGMNGWIAAGLDVKEGPKRLPLERQVRIAAGAMAAFGALLAITVNPLFAIVPAFVGSGLVYAGVTDRCGLALALGSLPWNQPASCDVEEMVRALRTGSPPSGVGRGSMRQASATASCGA